MEVGAYVALNRDLFYEVPGAVDCIRMIRDTPDAALVADGVKRATLGAFFHKIILREGCIDALNCRSGGKFETGVAIWERRMSELVAKVEEAMRSVLFTDLGPLMEEIVTKPRDERRTIYDDGDLFTSTRYVNLQQLVKEQAIDIPLSAENEIEFVVEDHLEGSFFFFNGAPYAREALCKIWKDEACEQSKLECFYIHMLLRTLVLIKQGEHDVMDKDILELYNDVKGALETDDPALNEALTVLGNKCAAALVEQTVAERRFKRTTFGVDMAFLDTEHVTKRLEDLVDRVLESIASVGEGI